MDEFLQNTKKAFDKAALTYDELDFKNPILQWMRGIVRSVYFIYIKEGGKVLELNSGTGIDAVFLAERGFRVFATDISDNMINIIKEKIETLGIDDKLSADRLSFSDISKVNTNSINAVVSNFGGLNCISDFSDLNNDISSKLESGGYFIAAVINKYCPWEMFFYSLKFQFATAFRRLKKGGVDASLEGEKVRTFYFTPRGFFKYFRNDFHLIKIYSLGLFTPPPYLEGVYKKLGSFVRLMMKLDNLVKGIPLLNFFGDHFIIVMKRK